MTDKPFDPQAFRESLEAAAGPLRRVAAVTSQIGLSKIPADAACCCHCPVYEPHECEGWRAEGLVREVPSGRVFGRQPPPVQVPVCRSCHGVAVRDA
jgi:hypothetical protein